MEKSPESPRPVSGQILVALVVVAVLALAGLYWWNLSPEQPATAPTPPDTSRAASAPVAPAPVVVSPAPAVHDHDHGEHTSVPSETPAVSPTPPQVPDTTGAVGVPARLAVTGSVTAVPRSDFVDPSYMREERREVVPNVSEFGRRYKDEPFKEMEFPLFDGESVQLTDVELRVLSPNEGVFLAKVKGDPSGGHFMLSYVGNAVSGTLHIPSQDRYFFIRNASPDGAVQSFNFLAQVDPDKMPKCGTCAPAQPKKL
jgi:hypothetical protein